MPRPDVLKAIQDYYPMPGDELDTVHQKEELLKQVEDTERPVKRESLLKALRERLPHYNVVDWCEEDAPGLEYAILLEPDCDLLDNDTELMKALGGARSDLYIHVSLISKVFFLCFQRTFYTERSGTWVFFLIDLQAARPVVDVADQCLVELGYKRISLSEVEEIVPHLELECTAKGDVTVFNCLFSELDDPILKPVISSAIGPEYDPISFPEA